jgi:1-deoxy-D-xylulose-5-phosphate reductoisomerase
VLGSTGSVGEQTLAVAAAHPERYAVDRARRGPAAWRSSPTRCGRFRPRVASVADAAGAEELRARLGGDVPCEIAFGAAGLDAVATADADLVVAALVGAAGLRPTLAAIRAGRDIALANKEVLVMAGALGAARGGRARRDAAAGRQRAQRDLPGARGRRPRAIAKLILTASGGPFRTWSEERIARATVEEALRHPNWDMGPKITIDSATLMNKGLEVIEARWLFDVGPERVEVVVPPAVDRPLAGRVPRHSVIAQLGLPDMRVPIAVALAHPDRLPLDVPRLDLAAIGRLDFETPDTKRFPCLELAYRALRGDEAAPAVLNAANEVSVEAFLAGGCRSRDRGGEPGGARGVRKTEDRGTLRDLDDVIAADAWARARAREWLAAGGGKPVVSVLHNAWAFVLLLSILVFVHELGHFLVARACGVRVLKFSIGFGNPIGFGKWRLRWSAAAPST